MNSVPNQSSHFPDFEINIEIDGIKYRTKLDYLSGSDVVAKIIEPDEYKDILVSGLHIPYFGMVPSNRYIYEGKMNHKVNDYIESALTDFHYKNQFFKSHKQEILKVYLLIKMIVILKYKDADMIDKNQFLERRLIIRHQLKLKEIDSRTYQRLLKEYTRKHELYFEKYREIVRDFSDYIHRRYHILLTVNEEEFYIIRYTDSSLIRSGNLLYV